MPFPGHLNIVDISAGRAGPAMLNGLLDQCSVAFKDRFDTTVIKVSHPSVEAQLNRHISCKAPVEDSLDPPPDEQMRPCSFHGGNYSRLSYFGGNKAGESTKSMDGIKLLDNTCKDQYIFI